MLCLHVLKDRAYDIVHKRGEVAHDIAATRPGIVLVTNAFLGSSHERFQPLQEVRSRVVAVQEGRKRMGEIRQVTRSGRCNHHVYPMVEDDGPYTKRATVAGPRVCRFAWSKYRHDQACVAATGDQPLLPAGALQRNAATYEGSRTC